MAFRKVSQFCYIDLRIAIKIAYCSNYIFFLNIFDKFGVMKNLQ